MAAHAATPTAAHFAALFGLSAAVLAFEVLLLRLFAFSHWHHFAGFAVALALLGLGAAGAVLTIAGERSVRHGDGWFLSGLLASGAGLLLVLWLHAHVALRPLFTAWHVGELGRLLLVDLAAFLPFFAAGLAIGQVFLRWPRQTRKLYAVNLLGSGAGSIGASLLLLIVRVETALAVVAALLLALGAGLVARRRRWLESGVSLLLLGTGAAVALHPPTLAVSDFKALAQLRALPDSRLLAEQPGLAGGLSVLRSDSQRFAPGLSLRWPAAVPALDTIVVGSDRVVPLARAYPAIAPHAAASLGGVALRLRPQGDVLVIGSGTWHTPALAGARGVTWIEMDGRLLALARERGATAPRFQLRAESPYRYLVTAKRRYAVIGIDHAYDGGDAVTEDYLLTREGMALALARLDPDGLLAVPLTLHYPPRQFPRLLRTVRGALEARGVTEPGLHVAALRGLQASLTLVSPTPLGTDDRLRLREFARQWGFDLVWLSDLMPSETNRFHRLDGPVFFETARAVFEGHALPAAATWFVADAADLDRPYFWRTLAWHRVDDLVATLGRRGLSYLDWTLLLQVVATVLVTVLAFVFMVAPLGRLPDVLAPFRRHAIAGYFAALGVGYMLFELAVFQRAILYLGEPVLAASVVFATFLIGSGIGSAAAPERLRPEAARRIYAAVAIGVLVAIGALWLATSLLLASPLPLRAAAMAIAMLPLAWALGRPFPWGLRQLAGQPRWIPWAWGINGFASVLGASLAPLIAVHLGQSITVVSATACYGVAAAIALHWVRPARR